MTRIPPFPKIIPELRYSSDEFLKPFFYNIKRKLVAKFLYKPIMKKNKIYLLNIKTKSEKYMPLFNLSYSLSLYNDYIKTKNKKYLDNFKEKCDELIKIIDEEEQLAGWKFKKNYDIPGYPPVKNSYSALFNARGLSMLCRYYQYKKDKNIKKLMIKILNTFETESDKGGVLKKENNNYWYLEYSYGNESPVVYNGFLSALIGLYETSIYGPNKEIRSKARKLYIKGLETIKKNKEAFFTKRPFSWLRYDSNKLFFADGDYFKIMKWQMQNLAENTKEKDIKSVLEKIQIIEKTNCLKSKIYEWPYQIYKKVIK